MKFKKTRLPNLVLDRNKFYTKSLVKNQKVYGERLIKDKGSTFRLWDATRSKLGAAIYKKANINIRDSDKVLYLGAASGTTVSHVSDIVSSGRVYAMDFAPRVIRDLLQLARTRKNLYPLLADANRPQDYQFLVEDVDIVFQDVAQKNQVDILKWNCDVFLKKDGIALLALKARSIDVTKSPDVVFKQSRKELLKAGFEILQEMKLEPYEKDHMFYVLKKR